MTEPGTAKIFVIIFNLDKHSVYGSYNEWHGRCHSILSRGQAEIFTEEVLKHMNPVARTHDLVIERDGVDLFIHDLQREKYILLNPVSAFVWKKCDGMHDSEAIAKELESEIGTKVSLSLIDSTVERLFSERLLEAH